jgi:hypothetical protein
MEEICEFIIVQQCATEKLGLSVLQFMTEEYTKDIIGGIIADLYRLLDKSEIKNIERYDENLGVQRAVIITFIYKNVRCDILQHFDTHRDYWRVAIIPL